jgi:peptidoglycan hydrolase-like protein with peptidoglycan-binding domain
MTIALSQAAFITLLTIAIPNLGVSSAASESMTQGVTSQDSTLLIATAFTDQTLPTLRPGDRGKDVQKLQQILLDNSFLSAASARLGSGTGGVAIDGVFGATTEAAVRDLQRRYKKRVNGIVTPATWETLDLYENPYRSPLPWKV